MKRSEALVLIANQLDIIDGALDSYTLYFSKRALGDANTILITLEDAGIIPQSIWEEE